MKKLVSFIVLILLGMPSYCGNPIIYLISPPRSLSTAFMRSMEARGDMQVLNEPSMKAHELMFCPQCQPDQVYYDDAPRSFEEVKELLYKKALSGPVFAKEISFAIINFFYFNSEDLLRNPDVKIVFLIRHPHATLLSFYLKKQQFYDGSPLGYKCMYELIQYVRKYAINKPHIVFAEDLYEHPYETVEAFCKAVDIPFLEHSLHWEDLGEEFSGSHSWHEIKKEKDSVQYWHGNAIRSTGFIKPRGYEVDKDGNPTFSEIIDSELKRICKSVYLQELFYYHLIEQEAHIRIKPVLEKK